MKTRLPGSSLQVGSFLAVPCRAKNCFRCCLILAFIAQLLFAEVSFCAGIGQGGGGKGKNFYICDKSSTNQKDVERAFLEFTEVRKDIAIVLITQGVAQHIRHLVDAHSAAVSCPLDTSGMRGRFSCPWFRVLLYLMIHADAYISRFPPF